MVCVIARESLAWNRPMFKAPRLDLKVINPRKPALVQRGFPRGHA
jgi:hypothetical protein